MCRRRIKYLTVYCFIVLFMIVIGQAKGQINMNTNLDAFGNPNVIDTSSINENDTIINKGGFWSLFKGKPGKAALLSLIIPSGGQIYNKKWWKVPLALGIDGALTYTVIYNRQQYKKSDKIYLQLLDAGDPLSTRYRQQRDYYRKWSEYSYIWLIGGHLITVVDAFVDRHLMEFDISPDLSVIPSYTEYDNKELVIQAGIKINLNKSNKVVKPESQQIFLFP